MPEMTGERVPIDAAVELAIVWAARRHGIMPDQAAIGLAVDLLLAGDQPQAIAVLAGVPAPQAQSEVPQRLDDALASVGVTVPLPEDVEDALAFIALHRRFEDGEVSRREIAQLVHEWFGHTSEEPVLVGLAGLADSYDGIDGGYGPPNSEETVNRMVDDLLDDALQARPALIASIRIRT